MNAQIFTVYDSAARRYLEPFFAPTVEVALRMFRTLANKEGHLFAQYPADYVLFHIGSFDGEDGTVTPLVAPHSMGVAIMFTEGRVMEVTE